MGPTGTVSPTPAQTPAQTPTLKSNSNKDRTTIMTLASLGLVLVILIVLVVLVLGLKQQDHKTIDSINARVAAIETDYKYAGDQVDVTRYQAVFLNNGQVYFGKITKMTADTMALEHIYYLQNGNFDKNTQAVSGANSSLVKLGNELHKPDDKMIIERKNVEFWENMKADGQVTKAIAQYEKQNP